MGLRLQEYPLGFRLFLKLCPKSERPVEISLNAVISDRLCLGREIKTGFEDGEVGICIVGPGKVCGRGFPFVGCQRTKGSLHLILIATWERAVITLMFMAGETEAMQVK